MRARFSVRFAVALTVSLLVLAGRTEVAALQISCSQPGGPTSNAILVCTGNPCVISQDFEAPFGCELDFGGRIVVFRGDFDVGNAFLIVRAGRIEVESAASLFADSTDGRGGSISLSTVTPPSPNCPRDCTPDIILGDGGTNARIDVSGNSAGLIRLNALGDVVMQSGATLIADTATSEAASAGSIDVVAGGSIIDNGTIRANSGNNGEGGSVTFRAAKNVMLNREINAIGGANDGGDIDVLAGDDILALRTLDTNSIAGGGSGGSVLLRAGLDTLGGVKVGGSLDVRGNIFADGTTDTSDGEASGADGGDVTLHANGLLTVASNVFIHANGGAPDGGGGSFSADSSDSVIGRISARDGDLNLAGEIQMRGPGLEGEGGDFDALAGRNGTITALVDVGAGDSGGDILAAAGKDLLVQGPLIANGTTALGNGGSVVLRSGSADFGTLTLARSIDATSGSSASSEDVLLSACNLIVQPDVTIDVRGGLAVGVGAKLDLAALGTMNLGASSHYGATPLGIIRLTHPPDRIPVIGAGAEFEPPFTDSPATSSTLYPGCPVCGDSIRQAGEVCDKGPAADGACCNADCSALICPTVTPTPTITPTATGPTLSATPTRTRTPTPTFTIPPRTPTATNTAPTPTGIAGTPVLPLIEPRTLAGCGRALGKAASRLALAELTAYEVCGLEVFKCIQQATAGADRAACLTTASKRCEGKLEKLTFEYDAFSRAVSASCGGVPPRVPVPLLRAPEALSFATNDALCAEEVGLFLDSLGAVSACVQRAGGCQVEHALAVALPRISDLLNTLFDAQSLDLCIPDPTGNLEGLADPAVAKLAVRCGKTASGSARKLLKRLIGAGRQCNDKLLKCRVSGGSVAKCQNQATRCRTKLDALTVGAKSARAKAATTIARACAAVPPDALLGSLGVGYGAAAAQCAEHGVAPLSGSSEVGECLARSYTCAGKAVVQRALPSIEGELARFGLAFADDPFCASVVASPTSTPVAPTATPIPATPTASPSVTPSAAETPTVVPTATAPTPSVIPTPTEVGATATPSATTEPSVTPTPVTADCGNGVLEIDEQCDFGDLTDGDGCSSTCLFELLIPGGGGITTDCVSEWAVINPNNEPPLDPEGLPNAQQTCVDGDPTCDADGIVNDECRFRLAICLTPIDPNLPDCLPPDGIEKFILLNPQPPSDNQLPQSVDEANAASITASFANLTPVLPEGRSNNTFVFDPPLAVAPPNNCTATVEFIVELRGFPQWDELIRIDAESAPPPDQAGGVSDRDTLELFCLQPAPPP